MALVPPQKLFDLVGDSLRRLRGPHRFLVPSAVVTCRLEFLEREELPPADSGIERDETMMLSQRTLGRHLSGHRRDGQVLELSQDGGMRFAQDRPHVDAVLRPGFEGVQGHRKHAAREAAELDQAHHVGVSGCQQGVGRWSQYPGQTSTGIEGRRRVDKGRQVPHEHRTKELLDEPLVLAGPGNEALMRKNSSGEGIGPVQSRELLAGETRIKVAEAETRGNRCPKKTAPGSERRLEHGTHRRKPRPDAG